MSLQLKLSEIAPLVGAPSPEQDATVKGVSTDTRTLFQGNLFIALSGAHYDGHDFIDAARRQGAAAVMVSRDVKTSLPVLRVHDTRQALAQLAGAWRNRFTMPLVGVTGSNGKTTVKEMIATVLSNRGNVLATAGNLNNEIGVPLTLLHLDASHDFAVIEMGANHPGEIAMLSALAAPTVAVITNAGPAHLEGFGSVEGVARAKGELYGGLRSDGTAVINSDDAFCDSWHRLAGTHRRVTFGIEKDADVTATSIRHTLGGVTLTLHVHDEECSVSLPMPGVHNVMNALAAAAAVSAAGASLADIKYGLESVAAVNGRMTVKQGMHGVRIIDDTYNANPGSLRAALDTLKQMSGDKIVVLGDMGELGDEAAGLHKEAGQWVRQAGVDRLYALGDVSHHAVQSFGAGGRHFSNRQALLEALAAELGAVTSPTTVLVKGSRSMAMEQVVQALESGAVRGGNGGAPAPDVKSDSYIEFTHG